MNEEQRRHYELRRQDMADYARRCGADTAAKVHLLLRSDVVSDVRNPWIGGTNDAEIDIVIEMMGLKNDRPRS